MAVDALKFLGIDRDPLNGIKDSEISTGRKSLFKKLQLRQRIINWLCSSEHCERFCKRGAISKLIASNLKSKHQTDRQEYEVKVIEEIL